MQCQQLPQSQKSEFIEKMNSLIRGLENETLMSGKGKREVIYNLHGFMGSNEIFNILKQRYELTNEQLNSKQVPPFSWAFQTRQDLNKDINQYLDLIYLCIEAEGEYIDKLIEKPSEFAKDMLKYWGVKVPFYQGSPRLQYISDHIVMLSQLVKNPKRLEELNLYPNIVIPYVIYIINELKYLQKT